VREVKKIDASIRHMLAIKRVAVYARVSSDKDAMLHSLSAQVSHYSGFIQSHQGWEYAGVYSDEGITGTKDKRPEFQRLLYDCRAGKIDIVLTKSISRFARNTVTLLETVRELKSLNVDVWFERENIRSLSGEGELILSLLASVAQEESFNVSENCKWRIRYNYKQGVSGGLCVYGYKMIDRDLVVIPDEADVVRMIFDDYISGMGTNAIMRKLNDLGIPAKHGGIWYDGRIYDMLRCEKYVGDLVLQKYHCPDHLTKKLEKNDGVLPIYIIHNNHEPIISREIFQRAQDEMEIRKKAGRLLQGNQPLQAYQPPQSHPFTGMIICGSCGQHYRRKVAHGKAAWNCGTFIRFGKSACHAKQIPDSTLRQVCCEALDLKQFDIDEVRRRVREIRVPAFNELDFIYHDGRHERYSWSDRSRSEAWTDTTRQAARDRLIERKYNASSS